MIDQSELKEMLEQHKLWLKNGKGRKLILRGADLRWSNLRGADLCGADLIYMQLNQYQVFVQRDKTRIGCEYHDNADWIKWTPDDVKTMAHDAYDFWKQYKRIIVAAIGSLQ